MSVHHVHAWCLEGLEKAIRFPGIWRYRELLSCHVGAKNRIQQYIFLQIKAITGYNVYFACKRAGLTPSTKKKKMIIKSDLSVLVLCDTLAKENN